MPSKMIDTITDVGDFVGRYPLSSAGATVVAFNWHYFAPLILQVGLFLVDFARQKYIKKERKKQIKREIDRHERKHEHQNESGV